MGSNNSFKPNLLRYTNNMAERACHVVASTTQVGLTQALGGMESDEAHVVHLERELLEPATRANLARVRELLADDFLEVGASGQSFGKAEVLSWLPAESGKSFAVTSIKAVTLGKGVILVTYAAERTYQGYITRSLRSSVWVKGAGGWQMRYHQGTAA